MTWPPRAAGTGDTRTEDVVWLHVDDAGSAGRVRRVAAEAATDLGLPARSVAELEIAAIELASNLAQHATDGVVLVRRLRRAGGPAGGAVGGVGLVSVDTGPGMPDLARSRRDGHSTAGTLGIGLGAIERLATRMDLHSLPGRGTVLAAEFWPPGVPPGAGTVDGLTRPITGEDTCGDGFAVRQLGDGRTLLLLCDGLGHGPLAATATRVAVDAFHTTTATDPAELVRQLHERLGTPGAPPSGWPPSTGAPGWSGTRGSATSPGTWSRQRRAGPWCRCRGSPATSAGRSANSTIRCPPTRPWCCTPTG